MSKVFFDFLQNVKSKIFYKNKNPPKIGFLKIYRNTKNMIARIKIRTL